MRGVGPGTVLGGRYTVHQRLEQRHDTERWSADDTTLGRSVSVLCIASDDHRTSALLDAARRAGSVTHPVFVRVLDVGHDDQVAYVVEEDLDEARDLAELVTDGGVPGDEVRRITGEVAAALESARQRGMHHLDLKPEDVLRTPDGDIRLRGLETAAVRIGEDGTEAEDAGRRDAVGVVALAYAGLTGLWPLGAGGSGLGAAPRMPGGVASPSEIAAGVPRDLDALCRLTLNDDQGPTSPGDFARQVAPWPSRQVVGRPVTRNARSRADAPPPRGAAGTGGRGRRVAADDPAPRQHRSCVGPGPGQPSSSRRPAEASPAAAVGAERVAAPGGGGGGRRRGPRRCRGTPADRARDAPARRRGRPAPACPTPTDGGRSTSSDGPRAGAHRLAADAAADDGSTTRRRRRPTAPTPVDAPRGRCRRCRSRGCGRRRGRSDRHGGWPGRWHGAAGGRQGVRAEPRHRARAPARTDWRPRLPSCRPSRCPRTSPSWPSESSPGSSSWRSSSASGACPASAPAPATSSATRRPGAPPRRTASPARP